jgi:competence protein ComEC
VRLPQPGFSDVSKVISRLEATNQSLVVTVKGNVESMPQLTRSQKAQFWLTASAWSQAKAKNLSFNLGGTVTGKLYVTVPLLQAKGLHPGQKVAVSGSLYKPKAATNPQAFNFRDYLIKEGAFAGFSGRQISILNKGSPWGWWAIRQRIVHSQVRWLGMPEGPLVSAMVLGSSAVDLPFNVRDEFTQVGLAHALAASGFQTSLILAVVLVLVRRFSQQERLILGTTALTIFACLSGFEPAVMRAVLMGIAGLLALVIGRKSKPVGVLLGVAVFLLLINPLWIWHLGFQLSFLATLGLIVMVPSLTQRLDGLPPAIATLLAVPLAASLWTLPLQLFAFGVFPPYSLLANLLTTPLISLITIGGFISGLMGLIWPFAGSALSWLLYYPSHILIALVHFFSQLPGSSLAVGTIALWQLVILYGLLCSVWLWPWWQPRWWLAGLVALGLVLIPVWQTKTSTFQVTILETPRVPVMVIQQPEATMLVNTGDRLTASLTVVPFLRQQGINQIDWAIATDTNPKSQSGWPEIWQRLSIKTFSYIPNLTTAPGQQKMLEDLQQKVIKLPFQQDQVVSVGSTSAKLIRADPLALQFQINRLTWLLLSDPKNAGQEVWLATARLPAIQVLWWSGKNFKPSVADILKPAVVILSSASVDAAAIAELQAKNIQVYWADRDGAIQWTPKNNFETTLDPMHSVDSKLN